MATALLKGSQGVERHYSPTSLFLIALLTICALLVASKITKTIRISYFGPLASVPGPWHAKIFDLALKYHTVRGNTMFYIHSLHERYGDVVRLGPERVNFRDQRSHKAIHKIGGGFLKSDWYRKVVIPEPDMFALADPREHAKRRKWYAQQFTVASLRQNWEQYIRSTSQLTVSMLKEEAEKGSANIVDWWQQMTMKVITKVAFGEDLVLGSKELDAAIKDIRLAAPASSRRVELGLMYKIAQSFVPRGWFMGIFNTQSNFLIGSASAAGSARSGNISTTNVFSNIVAEIEKDASQFTEDMIVLEAQGFIAAGSVTVGSTLTYLIYTILQLPDWQQKLEEEVAGLKPDYMEVDLEQLPILNAVMFETLRLYAAVGSPLPRTTPGGGATLNGYFIPENTVVGTQAYSMHRDERVFPNAEKYDPARFLGDPNTVAARKAMLVTFGGGSRICIGIYLAYMELRHSIAAFFRECRGVKLHESVTEERMRMVNYFTVEPAKFDCRVTLSKK